MLLPSTSSNLLGAIGAAVYLVFTDETNRNEGESKFFLIGGIAIHESMAFAIHQDVQNLRQRNGFLPGDSLKFARSEKPAHVSNDQFNAAKSEIIELCERHSIQIFLYACHHLIAANKSEETKFQWGCNAILWKINQFLTSVSDSALVQQDRHPVPGEFEYYRRKFTDSQPDVPNVAHKLDRILGFGSTCDRASHLASIADIVLGSYRYCINNPEKDIVNTVLMPRLLKSTWGFPDPIGKGVGIFPAREILKLECIGDYENLRAQIRKYIRLARTPS